ncbi:MAG: NADH-ubiquinone oxidoreductase-F iron-sulfur binding region domain-containing protein [Moorellales bacterium]
MEAKPREAPVITVGMGTCGLAAGAGEVWQAVRKYLREQGLAATVKPVGCIGLDDAEPLLDVLLPGEPRVSYGRVRPDLVPRILEEHLRQRRPVEEWVVGRIYEEGRPFPELDFYRRQERRVLRRCGFINPESLDEYLAWGGYGALLKVLTQMSPEQVIEAVKRSGLRGRGGAGFPTGTKWELARRAPGEKKFVVCNADEGDPGAFMDRSLLEGDPHAVLEGMLIGAYAIGATHGYIYVRAEYPLAVRRLKIALAQARQYGLVGENILGTGFSLDLRLREGAGAFVCGEETALMSSVEGKRGMPRPRPPFPAQRGLWGYPTNINNVETWANVPLVIERGPEWFAALGTPGSPGTKIFALTGKAVRSGLIEVPMGITLREIVFGLGGGMAPGRRFKAVQIGGPSGGCLPASALDTPVDYDSLTQAGAMMGSGGLVVLDDTTCMVDLARFFTAFNRRESCGKCTPCREGTQRMLEILERLTGGQGSHEDLERLEELAQVMKDTSLCGLGQTAPNPVLSTLRYFRSEYLAHIENRVCSAGVCNFIPAGSRREEEGLRAAAASR